MKNSLLLLFVIYSCSQQASALASPRLTAEEPIALPGAVGRFDFMATDRSLGRVLAAHKQAKTLEIIDLKSGKVLAPVEIGHAQGVAVDSAKQRYFLGNEDEQSVVFVDALKLEKLAEVKLDGPVDAIAFDTKNRAVYAAKDAGALLWVIDSKTQKVTGTIAIPGVPEVLEYDAKSDRVYLNIKDKNLVVQIDPAKNTVVASWPTAPASSPHGLAIDSRRGRVYTAGGNGKLVALDLKNGNVVSSADIADGVDQIAFDVDRDLLYSACKGFLSLTQVSDSGLLALEKIPSPKGAHTLAFDPIHHDVWVAFADEKHSYLQKFKATP